MAHTRLITINGSAGAYTTVLATQVTRRVEIIEDYSAIVNGVNQGLQYNLPDPKSPDPGNPIWLGPFSIAPQSEAIILGEPIPQGTGYGTVIGHGPDASGGFIIAATPLIQIRSASATATTIRVSEFA
jgi:hypothetical protein